MTSLHTVSWWWVIWKIFDLYRQLNFLFLNNKEISKEMKPTCDDGKVKFNSRQKSIYCRMFYVWKSNTCNFRMAYCPIFVSIYACFGKSRLKVEWNFKIFDAQLFNSTTKFSNGKHVFDMTSDQSTLIPAFFSLFILFSTPFFFFLSSEKKCDFSLPMHGIHQTNECATIWKWIKWKRTQFIVATIWNQIVYGGEWWLFLLMLLIEYETDKSKRINKSSENSRKTTTATTTSSFSVFILAWSGVSGSWM